MTTRPFYPASAPDLPEALWQELAEENPLGSDNITAQDAKDWFYLRAWPRFKTYPGGRSTNEAFIVRMVTRWWARVDGFEIIEARHMRAVKEGRKKPMRHRPRVGSAELPQERRHGSGEWQKAERLRLVQG